MSAPGYTICSTDRERLEGHLGSLVSSAITAGSPSVCSAVYSPSAYLTLPKHISFFFLSIGWLRADRCLPGEFGAP